MTLLLENCYLGVGLGGCGIHFWYGESLLGRIFPGGRGKWANFPLSPQYGKNCLCHWEDSPLPIKAVNTSGLRHYIQNQKVRGAHPARCSTWLKDSTLLRSSWWPSSWINTVCIGVSTPSQNHHPSLFC